MDSQSVKRGASIDPHGFDAGKLIKGKKRHLPVDTLGLLLAALVTAADIQDRCDGILLMSTLFGQFPFLQKPLADSAYAGPIFQDGLANAMPGRPTEIVRRSDHAKGFVVEPKRLIVERTIALAPPSSPARQGLGKSQPQCARISPPRFDSPYA